MLGSVRGARSSSSLVTWWTLRKHKLGSTGKLWAAEAVWEQRVLKECLTDNRNRGKCPRALGREKRF